MQHKWALTSGSFDSLLFFFAPHGMCGRRQEKDDPELIVRYQGAVKLRLTIYEVGTWDAVQEASLHYTKVSDIA